MKRTFVIVLILLFSTLAIAEDSKEIMIVKRDLAIERIMRIRTEIELMRLQFKSSQDNLKAATKDFEEISAGLQKLESGTAKTK